MSQQGDPPLPPSYGFPAMPGIDRPDADEQAVSAVSARGDAVRDQGDGHRDARRAPLVDPSLPDLQWPDPDPAPPSASAPTSGSRLSGHGVFQEHTPRRQRQLRGTAPEPQGVLNQIAIWFFVVLLFGGGFALRACSG